MFGGNSGENCYSASREASRKRGGDGDEEEKISKIWNFS